VLEIARAYPTLLRVGLAETIAYRAEFLVWVLTTTLPLIMLAIWTAAAREAPIGRFGQAEFTAYYLAALIVRQTTGSWVVWELNMEIRQGTLPLKMLRPMHPLIAYSAESLAAIPMRSLLALPVAILLLVSHGGRHVPHDPARLAILLLAILGAWLLQFAVMATVGSLAMIVHSSTAIYEVWLGLFAVLSGYLVPLELLPRSLAAVARVLPFRYMLGFPVELLTGALPARAALGDLAVQWALALALCWMAGAVWRAGARRYQAFGG
jgi:ABC-2 type transport system permease protein